MKGEHQYDPLSQEAAESGGARGGDDIIVKGSRIRVETSMGEARERGDRKPGAGDSEGGGEALCCVAP
eukprot:8721386-Heterocapsa_arctica.AAC.1